MIRRTSIVLGLATVSALATALGCAGRAPAPAPAAPARSVPDAITEDEALIDSALTQARDPNGECPDRCRSAEAVCQAADRICTIVGELRDVALAPRCDRARGACASGRESVSACACAPVESAAHP